MPTRDNKFIPFTKPKAGRFKHNHSVCVLMTHQTVNASKIRTHCGATYPAAMLERIDKMPARVSSKPDRLASLPLGPALYLGA